MNPARDPLQDPQYADVLARLRGQTAPEPSADFTARTLARLHQKPAPRTAAAFRILRAAAALALLLGAGLWFARTPAPVAHAPAPVDILMAAQRSDGGWSAA